MSPLITFMVILLVTVVYNESQSIIDYQDSYQNLLKENSFPSLELCSSASQRKHCERLVYGWKQFFKDDDVFDFNKKDTSEYGDWMNNDVDRIFNEKRDNSFNCKTIKQHIFLGDKFFPSMLANISCRDTSDFHAGQRICLRGSNCQPVLHMAKVLRKRDPGDTVQEDLPKSLQSGWKHMDIPIEVGCRCFRAGA